MAIQWLFTSTEHRVSSDPGDPARNMWRNCGLSASGVSLWNNTSFGMGIYDLGHLWTLTPTAWLEATKKRLSAWPRLLVETYYPKSWGSKCGSAMSSIGGKPRVASRNHAMSSSVVYWWLTRTTFVALVPESLLGLWEFTQICLSNNDAEAMVGFACHQRQFCGSTTINIYHSYNYLKSLSTNKNG